MATPSRPNGSNKVPQGTPKLGRGINPPDMRYDSQSIHQSGSKVVQNKHDGLKEQFMKRNTELAELLRSASKKRAKTSEAENLVHSRVIPDRLGDFPAMSGLAVPEESRHIPIAESTRLGSLFADTSIMEDSSSPVRDEADAAEAFFSGLRPPPEEEEKGTVVVEDWSGQAYSGAATTVTTHTVTTESVSGSLRMQMQEVEESSDEESLQDGHQLDGDGDLAFGADCADDTQTAQRTDLSAADISFRSHGPEEEQSVNANVLNCSGIFSSTSAVKPANGEGVAKALLFSPDFSASFSGPRSSAGPGHDSLHKKPFEQPPLVSFAVGSGALGSSSGAGSRTPLLHHRGPGSRFTSPQGTAAGRASASRFGASGGTGGFTPAREVYMDVPKPTPDSARDDPPGSAQGPGEAEGRLEGERHLVPRAYKAAEGGSYEGSPVEESSPTSYSYIYRENLLHQLKVATSKNAMLEGKLRDIEQLVDKNYGTISERSRILAAERNKLERQRAVLDDELVATKEELVFIRAQLQSKSARISELEMELLEAHRRLLGPSDDEGEAEEEEGGTEAEDQDQDDADSDRGGGGARADADKAEESEDDATGGAAWEEQHEVSVGARRTAPAVGHSNPSPAVAATLSQEDAENMYSAGVEMELHLQRDEREISLLKEMLVEQERQLIESAARAEATEKLFGDLGAENAEMAAALARAEDEREELLRQVVALEGRLREAEDAAFEQEARAAELEVELFRSMDEDHERALLEAKAEAKATEPAVSSSAQAAATAEPALRVMAFRSDPSPCLPLRKAPHARPRIPREGCAGLLALVALLLIAIWALVLLCAFLYLGVLEQRFGVDILSDGGVYQQLFMLRGVRTLAEAAQKQLLRLDWQELWRSCEEGARSVAVLCLHGAREASVAVQALMRK